MASINKITVGDVDYNISIPSGLTEEEQEQIRQNIGAVGQGESTVVQDGTYPEMTVGEATHAQTADDATNAMNDADGNNIPNTYVKISDFDRLILENEYPVGGKPYIQFEGMQTPAQRWAGTSWEIDTDYAGRVLVGSGAGYTLGATGGEATHTLTVDEMPSHHHPLRYGFSEGAGEESELWIDYSLKKFTGGDGAAVMNTGGSQSHNNMPPYVVVNIWKRTA